MDFIDRFKRSDIICSDRFRHGKLMIVEDYKNSFFMKNGELPPYYSCVDLFDENQGWGAYEFTGFGEPYNWRHAKDSDYIREINKRLFIGEDLGPFGEIVEVDDHHLWIQTETDTIGLSPDQALKLADFIYEKIGRT